LADAVCEQGIRHVIVGVDRYVGPLYDAMETGGVIARFGVGHDGVDKDLATRKGLLCTNTPAVLDDSVAELTIALVLAAARHVPAGVAATRRREWSPKVGRELRGKRLAIIGCGSIGRRVARIASSGFGMDVTGCDVISVDMKRMRDEFGFTDVVTDFAAAVADADYVSLHIPGTPETRHLVNRERLETMPGRAWLINTARGTVVDETALFDAISEGRLAGAALDVFEREPYDPVQPDKDLRTLENVVMTPHIGSSTQEACHRMALRALRNIGLAEERRFDEMDLLNPAVTGR
jgi:lactate dehydrogenase-like 2-hydroxyacid dehydrogenase